MRRIVRYVFIALSFAMTASLFACGSGGPLTAAVLPLQPYMVSQVMRDVAYTETGDRACKMDIYLPSKAKRPAPAVVYLHGGGWYSGDKTDAAVKQDILELISGGYTVAAVNYRLAPLYKFPAQIEDVKCAIRFLRAHAATYGIDPSRIGIWGCSAGGHLAALAAVAHGNTIFACRGGYEEQSDAVQAVVDCCGPADLEAFFTGDMSPFIEHVFNTSDYKSPAIKQASPISHVSPDDPPFLIIHGAQDEVVSPEQSVTFCRQLQEAQVPATLLMVENASHDFTPVDGLLSPCRSDITRAITDFFDQHIK